MSDEIISRPYFGGFALGFALIALAFSILPSWMESVDELEQQTLTEKLTESAHKAKQSFVDKWQGRETLPEEQPLDLKKISPVVSMGLGFLAVVCGVIAYVRREDLRLSATAAVIGVTAIAWHDLFAAIALGLMLVIIGFVVRGLAHQ